MNPCRSALPSQKDCITARFEQIIRMQIPEMFVPPARVLLGPGPSEVAPSVLRAMSRPLVGHLDPVFVTLMEQIKSMLREVFFTRNEMTFPVSGTGSAGMEFCFVNLVE